MVRATYEQTVNQKVYANPKTLHGYVRDKSKSMQAEN